MPIADKVPKGIDFLGFFKSPLMAIPAVKPVTAGKNTANTTSKGTEPSVENRLTVSGAYSVVPKKIEINEMIMAARIKNCAFRAIDVLIKAKTVSEMSATVPVNLISSIETPKPKKTLKLSAKPIKYKAMEKAVPTYKAIPMEPPMGIPILRDNT